MLNAVSTPAHRKASLSPMPCQVTPSKPRAAHVVGTASASRCAQFGSRNDGNHKPAQHRQRQNRQDGDAARRALVAAESRHHQPRRRRQQRRGHGQRCEAEQRTGHRDAEHQAAEEEDDDDLSQRHQHRGQGPARQQGRQRHRGRTQPAPETLAALAQQQQTAVHAPEQQVLQRHAAETVAVGLKGTGPGTRHRACC